MQVHFQTGSLVAAGDASQGTASTPILPYWPELVFGLIVFALFYWVVKTKVVPVLEKTYAERTAAIEGGMEEAEKAKAEAEAAKAEYEQQLATAHAEANKIREDARAQGAQIVAEARDQASTEANRITESAHKSIAADRQQAEVSLRGDVGRLSTDLASKIVGESLHDETRQRGIVERFLADLEAGEAKAEPASATSTGGSTAFGAES